MNKSYRHCVLALIGRVFRVLYTFCHNTSFLTSWLKLQQMPRPIQHRQFRYCFFEILPYRLIYMNLACDISVITLTEIKYRVIKKVGIRYLTFELFITDRPPFLFKIYH